MLRRLSRLSTPQLAFLFVVALAPITGIIFFSFWIGWIVQLTKFTQENNALVGGYDLLFAIPAVADAWSVFSCFLYGFLILVTGIIVIIYAIGTFCLKSCYFCCMADNNSGEMDPIYSHKGGAPDGSVRIIVETQE
jgi:hypothetical protein